MENKNNMMLWGFIVMVIIVGLVFLTVKHKAGGQDKNINPSVVQKDSTNNTSGLQSTVIQEGNGDLVKVGDKVSVNYTGSFKDGTAFDSNVDPKFNHVAPFTFTVGKGEVIPGWDQGVVGMKVGEKRMLEVSPELAYGANGYPPVIPPNSTLIFQVELVGIIQ